MTQQEARTEAKRRWGIFSGAVLSLPSRHIVYDGIEVRGAGDSWEAAFADADRKAERLLMGREP